MGQITRRFWLRLGILVSATVFQIGVPTSCIEFGTQLTLTAFDFCGVVNCEGGTFFDLCEPQIIFVDCISP
jgi:hypothetical protein